MIEGLILGISSIAMALAGLNQDSRRVLMGAI